MTFKRFAWGAHSERLHSVVASCIHKVRFAADSDDKAQRPKI